MRKQLQDVLSVDKSLYSSCQEYVDRLVKQRLIKTPRSACDGSDGIRELCEKCPYYRFSKVNRSEN